MPDLSAPSHNPGAVFLRLAREDAEAARCVADPAERPAEAWPAVAVGQVSDLTPRSRVGRIEAVRFDGRRCARQSGQVGDLTYCR